MEVPVMQYSIKCSHKTITALVLGLFLLQPLPCFSAEPAAGKTLIIYYSRTGNSRLISQVLQKELNAQVLEIKDLKDRSGSLGYAGAGFDGFFDRHTTIDPAKVDLSAYSNIIVVSPIWNWKLSTPIHTFIDNNRLDGKNVVLFTNGNNDIRKYEQYDDNAPFLKRFFRDYIRNKSKGSRDYVTSTAGGNYVRHCHVETLEASSDQITQRTRKQIDYVKSALAIKTARADQER
jgi:menaquinone-dependent protoporphyrinogen IX oxidase